MIIMNTLTKEEKHQKHLEYQRKYRARTNNKCTAKYEKTPNGFIMRMYRNMQSRVTGVQSKKAHLYLGLPLLDRQSFYDWVKKNDKFWELYNDWVFSGYNRKYTPTVDRINPSKGYELGNMEIVTHSENSSRGSKHQWQMKHEALKNGQ
jgi:hypothetical protein